LLWVSQIFFSSQGLTQRWQVPIALDLAEPRLDIPQCRGQPALPLIRILQRSTLAHRASTNTLMDSRQFVVLKAAPKWQTSLTDAGSAFLPGLPQGFGPPIGFEPPNPAGYGAARPSLPHTSDAHRLVGAGFATSLFAFW
jgi:hypothetical protein